MAIVKATPELVAKALAATDWQSIDAQSDSDVARYVAQMQAASLSRERPDPFQAS